MIPMMMMYISIPAVSKLFARERILIPRPAVPVAFLMAWYLPVRGILEPWIQFIRNIPPLAYVPLVVITAGVGRKPQIIVIWIATFLIMTVTIYQGVRNIDNTLVKAARVLGAKDRDIFVKVIFPAVAPVVSAAINVVSATEIPSRTVLKQQAC